MITLEHLVREFKHVVLKTSISNSLLRLLNDISPKHVTVWSDEKKINVQNTLLIANYSDKEMDDSYHRLFIAPLSVSASTSVTLEYTYTLTKKLLYVAKGIVFSPKKALTNVTYGWVQRIAESSFSKPFIPLYSSRFKDRVPLSEYQDPYDNLFSYFTRTYKELPAMKHTMIVSPCNGKVVQSFHHWKNDNDIVSVKGEAIPMSDVEDFDKCQSVCNIYLQGSDYHHFHSPMDGTIEDIYGFKNGRKYLFNDMKPEKLSEFWDVINENSKLIIKLKSSRSTLYMMIVGGAYVNSIHLDEKILVNFFNGKKCKLKKGDHVGYFRFGSTIVLFTDAQLKDFDFCEDISVGDSLSLK